MASNITAFIQMIADAVPYVVDMRYSVEYDTQLVVRLSCLDGLEIRHAYDMRIVDGPHAKAYVCDELMHNIQYALGEKQQADWQKMNASPDRGIALCRIGEWSMRQQIAWHPPSSLTIYLPGSARIQYQLILRGVYELTRVAMYQG